MKINACAVVMAVGAIFLPLKAEEIYRVEAGETFEVTDANNLADNRVDISGNATLKLSGTATDGVFPLKINLNFVQDKVTTQNPAVLTVDVADCSAVRMTGHIRNNSGGGKIAFPQGVKLFEVGAATRKADTHTDFTAFQGDVLFADADGYVKFVNDVSLVNLPTCAYSIADGSRIATLGKEALGKGDFEVSSYDVELCWPESFSKNATITVPDGKKLLVRPVRLSNSYSGTWGGSPGSFDNNVVLGGAEAHIDFLNKNEITGFTGIISGSGDINLKGTGSVSFKGKLSYEGELVAEKAPAGGYTFNLESGSDVVPAVVAKVTGTKFYIDPNAGANGDKALSMNLFEAEVGVSEISVAANTELRIDKIVGGVRLSSSGDNASVQIVSLAAGAVLYVTPGVALTVESAAADAKVVFEADAQGNMDWSLSGPTSGEALKIAVEFPDGAASSAELTLGGKVALSANTDVKVKKLTILSGAEITADIADGVSIHNKGGVIKQRSWKDKIALWVDASAEDTFRYTRETWPNLTKIEENQLIEWRDCRADHQKVGDLRIAVTPFCPGYIKPPSTAAHWISFPYADTIDGRKCVWLAHKSGRAFVANGFSATAAVNVNIKFALLVFNGKNGGGNALLGTENSRLKRRDSPLDTPTADMVDDPLVHNDSWNNAAVHFRTNGVDIASPTKTPLTGGWQIIALAREDGINVGSICHAGPDNASNGNGGQIFAEIMLFDKMPTEEERDAAESYLAKKWNLPVAQGESVNQNSSFSMYGDGTVALSVDTEMTVGVFSGKVNLNGQKLSISTGAGKLPFRECDVPADGRELWIDPSLEGAVVLGGDEARPDEVAYIHARDNNGLLTADSDRCVASPYNSLTNRRVRAVAGTRAAGNAATWLDFRDVYGNKNGNDGSRNHLQVKAELGMPIPESYGDTKTFVSVDVRSGFFALDTSRGGGTVLSTTVRATSDGFTQRDSNDPIWKSNADEAVRTAGTYLDGKMVDATKNAYSKCPEVLSFNIKEESSAQKAKVFGYSGTSGEATSFNDEIMGEWILYSKTLDDDTRRGIEAYLMWKWLGKRLDGYSDFRGMTVVGDGVLAAAGPEYLPELTDEFTGSLEFSRTEWEFTLPKDGGSAAVDAVDLSGREVALPTAISVKINGKGAANGTYSLFKAGVFTGVEDISISDDSNLGNKRATLIVSENEISVRIESRGTSIVIR